MEILSKQIAKERGLKRYYTGIPCVHGHDCERYVSNDFCYKCSGEYHKKYKRKNVESVAAAQRDWKIKNRKRHSELNKISRERHLEKTRARAAKYGRDNPEVNKAARMRRCLKLGGKYFRVSAKFIKSLEKKQNGKCAGCFKKLKKGFHIDHIIPVAKGGDNKESNLQALCPDCNHSKHAKDPFVWAQENGRLL
jgi:5-methylcytosine-specific restriction endonuclease McrA